MTERNRDQIAIDSIRFLSVDMVEKANSGHPGAPMGQAPLAYWLWTRHLRHDPARPDWPNRDRFVLSCGHASALIYSMLHLSGYDLSMDELKAFRQLGSKTPGHPEHGLTAGVETTTGPLGQGVSNAVGMAIAERFLAAQFNRDGFPLIDNITWVIASDGDLMEGVSAEASSMAGHLGLGKLNVFYDANQISIDGSTDLAFTEDVVQRYQAYGWHTLEVDDVNDLDALDAAMNAARAETERPTLVLVRTHIGFGSPNKQDTAGAHGAPLGDSERRATRENLGWAYDQDFQIPDEARAAFDDVRRQGAASSAEWDELFERYRQAHPEEAAQFEAWGADTLTAGWDADLPEFTAEDGPIATRSASGKFLHSVSATLPQLIGGSADLAPSNNTFIKDRGVHTKDNPGGSNFHFGVREHGMGAVMNGMALSGRIRPYGATFLMFSDYMRPTLRLAALMEQPAIFIFTHDSVFLGEDGPTHQPISQLMGLRTLPGFSTFRPADANETVAAWRIALENTHRPSALVLTRQKLPVITTAEQAREGVARGAYVIADTDDPQVLLLATGSEVALALDAHRVLLEKGIRTRVVSMPSWDVFETQDADYRESVIPSSIRKRLAIEAGTTHGWHRYVGLDGDVQGIDGFGASAPYADLKKHFGFTTEDTIRRVEALLD